MTKPIKTTGQRVMDYEPVMEIIQTEFDARCFDERFRGMSTPEIFRILMQEKAPDGDSLGEDE